MGLITKKNIVIKDQKNRFFHECFLPSQPSRVPGTLAEAVTDGYKVPPDYP
jgi:hypothetical protein